MKRLIKTLSIGLLALEALACSTAKDYSGKQIFESSRENQVVIDGYVSMKETSLEEKFKIKYYQTSPTEREKIDTEMKEIYGLTVPEMGTELVAQHMQNAYGGVQAMRARQN